MEPFGKHTGKVVPLDRANVDTDQILPKQYLKRIERTGFGQYLFHHWRFREDGSPDPRFELNQPAFQGATILLAAKNFGSGSSREHAVWALTDFGFRAVIAPSFADIFYNNCFKNGLLPVTLPEESVAGLMEMAGKVPGFPLTIDLEACEVTGPMGFVGSFQIDRYRRHCLLQGLDDIGITMQHAAAIARFEEARPAWLR